MANNYTPSYNQYLTQTAGYALPSSVRTYSVFDPSSNSWKRMTNNGMSPMPTQGQTPVVPVQPMTPAQEQAAVAGALAQAQQTQGRVWNPLPQTPAQTPLGGSRRASPASGGGTVVVPVGRPKTEAPAGSQAVPAGNPYMGYAESRREFEDPDAFLHEVPRGTAGAQGQKPVVAAATPVNLEEVSQVFQPPMDRGYQFNEPVRRPPNVRQAIDEEYNNIPLRLHQAYGLMGGGLNVGPALASFRAGDASVAAARKAYQEGMMKSQLRRPAPSKQTSTPFSDAPDIEAANRFSPLRSDWVSPKKNVRMNPFVTTPSGTVYRYKPMLGYETRALPAPRVEVPTGRINPIQTPEVITPYGGFRALPNGANNLHMGTIEAGGIRPNIASPLQMTTPSGLARWQYRLDQLSGLR